MKRAVFVLIFLCALLEGGRAAGQATFSEIDTVAAEAPPTRKQLRKTRPHYLTLGAGLAHASLRDAGTSPLRYQGALKQTEIGLWRMDERRERTWSLGILRGTYGYTAGTQQYATTQSGLELMFRYLWGVSHRPGAWNLKVGGEINNATNLRINPSFLNAAVGFENFLTAFAVGKLEYRFRVPARRGTFFIFPYDKPERKFLLSYQLHLPVLQTSLRPGYPYLPNAVPEDATIFDGQTWRTWQGFRMGSRLSVIRYFSNNANAVSASYVWDTVTTGKHAVHTVELARHTLLFSLLFRLN
ncbi:hypothetical protein SAMN05421823_110259 [Catalinimonas alkaloidigena]|uniref:Outer membrane protein beta-barrel domain-containing protein n=1 Tax=Catalinimonas alkaloidigena TaxID=1075417 RepID=A0A1G9QRI5_9BACT|nr:hypothetical protein [Catalinimonas alkaloidigena]SDM13177.1 hypothetical protein SAMN05421823_110259 [Catalinimonas alkaloidigena]